MILKRRTTGRAESDAGEEFDFFYIIETYQEEKDPLWWDRFKSIIKDSFMLNDAYTKEFEIMGFSGYLLPDDGKNSFKEYLTLKDGLILIYLLKEAVRIKIKMFQGLLDNNTLAWKPEPENVIKEYEEARNKHKGSMEFLNNLENIIHSVKFYYEKNVNAFKSNPFVPIVPKDKIHFLKNIEVLNHKKI